MENSHILPAPRLVKIYCTLGVRAPVRPNIDPMLGSLLEVEEHPAAEDAEKRRIAERGDNSFYRRILENQRVSYDGENRDRDGSERESARRRCGIWMETHSMKYIV